jgi:hypothetical protein
LFQNKKNTFIPLSVVKRQPMMLTGQDGLYQSTGYSEGQESANFYAAFTSSPAEYQLPLRSRDSAQQPAGLSGPTAGLYEPGRPAVRYDPARPAGNYHRDSGVYLGGPSPGYASELDLSGRYRSYKDSSGDQGKKCTWFMDLP